MDNVAADYHASHEVTPGDKINDEREKLQTINKFKLFLFFRQKNWQQKYEQSRSCNASILRLIQFSSVSVTFSAQIDSIFVKYLLLQENKASKSLDMYGYLFF